MIYQKKYQYLTETKNNASIRIQEKGKFALVEKPKPTLLDPTDAIVRVVALYDEAQTLPLPHMYGKNLTFKTGGVDGCDCEEILKLIAEGKIDTTPLITHRFPLSQIGSSYIAINS